MKQYLSVIYHYAPRILLLVILLAAARVSYTSYVSYERGHAKGPEVVLVRAGERPEDVAHAASCLSEQKIPYQFDGSGNLKIHQGNAALAAARSCSS